MMGIDDAYAAPPGTWCALCVRRKIKKDGRFHGSEGLGRAVTTFLGTPVCAEHVDGLLDAVLGRVDE